MEIKNLKTIKSISKKKKKIVKRQTIGKAHVS